LIDHIQEALHVDFDKAAEGAARLAELLASNLLEGAAPKRVRGGLAPWQKRKIQRYIHDGLGGPLPNEALANLVSLSASHFYRAFKQSFDEAPHAYIIRMRVERAKSLMLTTSESLAQIASVCGMADQAHFSRCFRRITGTTPGGWRRDRGDEVPVDHETIDRGSPGVGEVTGRYKNRQDSPDGRS
jgi:transcriptional regulator GlxA family with amidase domain